MLGVSFLSPLFLAGALAAAVRNVMYRVTLRTATESCSG